MFGQPLVSVIIISYNCGHLLPKALDACRRQSFRDFELVLINNGSSDDTQRIMEQFVASNPGIPTSLINYEQNCGADGSHNAGLEAARGTYLLFNDADDWMADNCLQLLAGLAKESDADCVCVATQTVTPNGEVKFTNRLAAGATPWMRIDFQGYMIRRSLFLEHNIRFVAEAYQFDYFVAMQVSRYANKLAFTNEVAFYYLVNEQSMTAASYKRSRGNWWAQRFATLLDVLVPLMRDLSPKQQVMFEYATIQLYYAYVFKWKGQAFAEFLSNYRALRAAMRAHFPCYTRNGNIKLWAPNGDSGQFKKNIWLASLAEEADYRLHGDNCMGGLLLAYHLANRLKLYRANY